MAGGDSADVSVCVMSATLRGVEALPITVEVSLSGGIPGIDVIGTRDPSILEARSQCGAQSTRRASRCPGSR